MIQITTVILNWNGKKDTVECLTSLRSCKTKDFELNIILVDNGSTDDSIKIIKSKFKDINIIEAGINLGYVGGNNTGIKQALKDGSDFICLLNNDTTVKDDFFIQILLAVDKHKDAGILSPKIFFSPGFEFHKNRYTKNELGRVIWSAGGIIDWKNVLASNYGVDDTDIGQYSTFREIDFATGACMFIRREVFEKVGLLNEKYFLYLEDVEFSVRVKKAGWKILFVPEAYVWHKVSQSSGIGGTLNDYFITRNRLLFGTKFAPYRAKSALLRESIKLYLKGREWQKKGVIDFFTGKLGKGSWK